MINTVTLAMKVIVNFVFSLLFLSSASTLELESHTIITVCDFIFQYEGQGEEYSNALDYLNMIFTGVFAVEFVLKLMAFRVKVCPHFTSQLTVHDLN